MLGVPMLDVPMQVVRTLGRTSAKRAIAVRARVAYARMVCASAVRARAAYARMVCASAVRAKAGCASAVRAKAGCASAGDKELCFGSGSYLAGLTTPPSTTKSSGLAVVP